MNQQELKDANYAKRIASLQQKLATWAINESMYEEAYENERSTWLMESTKERVGNIIK